MAVPELMFSLLLMAVGGIVWSLRDNTNPAALWTWGWLVLVACSLFFIYGEEIPWVGAVVLLTSALLPAFLFAGARAYADRPVREWVLPVALLVGAFRWGLAQSEVPITSHMIGMLAEPALELAAAWYVFTIARTPGAAVAQKLLAPAIACVAVVDGLTALAVYREIAFPTPLTVAWYVVGLVTFGLQMTSAGHRSRAIRNQLQQESEETRSALRESQERFALLAENVSDMITELDSSGRIVYMSPSSEHVLGRRPEELEGLVGVDLVHADDRESVTQILMSSTEQDECLTALFRAQHANGSWRWIEANYHSFRRASGEKRVVAISRDVTERQEHYESLHRSHESLERRVEDRTVQLRAAIADLEQEIDARRSVEEQLRVSRERYRMVSEISSDFSFCFRFSSEGYLETEWVTDAFTRLTGYTSEAMQGYAWREIVDPRYRQDLDARVHEVVRLGSVEFEQRIITKSGETRWFHFRLTGRTEAGRDGIYVVGASRDVTEHRKAEQDRRQLEAHLNDVQRLESLGVLAGGIAHDFNNLLSVILGNTSLLILDAGEESDAGQRLTRIRSAGQHAARLTEQMLTYSGKTPFSLKPIDLSRVVEETRDLLEATISKRSHLEIELADYPIAMEGDETQLRQVIMNLVSNAAEALGEGGGTVRIRTGATDVGAEELALSFGSSNTLPGAYVYVEVEDDGPGIPAARRERIFDPFFTTRRSGRGLGLATVIGIIRGHQGAIQLESEAGHGATFRVLFPRSSGAGEGTAKSRAPQPHADVRATVLIIDDEEDVLELATEFLRRAGFDVLAARGGQAGVATVERQGDAIDLVVLDLVMPDLGGEETFRRIRELQAGLPVLLTSGYDEERTVDRFSSEELLGFLGKPYEPEELIEKVKATLAG
ncbi:MAG: PAS domain S-box protein [Deltaproteobacteria bacterium]|nr:PAS domain S-box protein [Deltaproteobacteria bacterium]